ncbi:hypothetical protein [Bacillus sp. 3G2]
MTTELFVPIGRDLGLYDEKNGERFYAVGSSLSPIILTHVEYFAWSKLRYYSSIFQWQEELSAKLKPKFPKLQFEDILLKLLRFNLIMPWYFEDAENSLLVETFATRNGVAYGCENNKWRIGSALKRDNLHLTREQYALWNAAAGSEALIEILSITMTQLGMNDTEVLALLNEQGAKLIKLGLWNVEYLPFMAEGADDVE